MTASLLLVRAISLLSLPSLIQGQRQLDRHGALRSASASTAAAAEDASRRDLLFDPSLFHHDDEYPPEESPVILQSFPGSDQDVNGCIPSAGYSWCSSLQECIRPWEIACSCNPVPIRTETTFMDGREVDIEIFTETKYFVVLVTEKNKNMDLIDPYILGQTFEPAYNASTLDCNGDNQDVTTTPDDDDEDSSNNNNNYPKRSIANCTVILTEINNFEQDTVLIQCLEYTSTSIDRNTTIYYNETQDYYGDELYCETPDDDICECPGCTINDDSIAIPNCVCYAPYIDTLVENWNVLYQNQSDPLRGENVTIVNVTELLLLPSNCSTGDNITYYNSTLACVPWLDDNRTELFGFPTIEPTAAPTGEPTAELTSEPTAEPTAEPTEKETDSPTDKPTPVPTPEPTAIPTPSPTTAEPTEYPTSEPTADPTNEATTSEPTGEPTSIPTIEDIICSTSNQFLLLCAALRETDLIDELLDQDEVTLFAPTDEAFLKYFDNGKSVSTMEVSIDNGEYSTTDGNGFSLQDILLLHATNEDEFGVDDLRCNRQITTFLVGQSTTTECLTTSSGEGQFDPGFGVSVAKAQVGIGNESSKNEPEIINQISNVYNGVILVINNVILPGVTETDPGFGFDPGM